MKRNGRAYLVIFSIVSIVEILLVSGITYGWASFVGVFEQEGFYESLCGTSEPNKTAKVPPLLTNSSTRRRVVRSAPASSSGSASDCIPQSERLNLVFTISVFSLCGVTFLIGGFVDKFGPRASRLVGCVIYTLSGIGLAFASKDVSNILFPVFIGFCTGGAFISMAIYQVTSLLFDRVKSLILCILHGTFDSSAVILLLFKVSYDGGFSLKEISLAYTVICFVIVLPVTFLLIPSKTDITSLGLKLPVEIRQSIHGLNYIGVKLANYNADLLEDNVSRGSQKNRILERMSLALELDEEDDTKQIIENNRDHAEENNVDQHAIAFRKTDSVLPPDDSLWKAIATPLYLTELFFLSVIQLRLWFFIGAFESKLELLTNNDKSQMSFYSSIFGYAQLCGIAVAPLIGLVFDKNMLRLGSKKFKSQSGPEERSSTVQKIQESILPFVITFILALLLCGLSLIKRTEVIIPCCILHVVVRGFVYSDHAAFIGIAFAPRFFGRLYGLGIFLAGVFGLLQFLLFVITNNQFQGDPFWMDVILLCTVLLGCIQPLYLVYFCKKAAKMMPSAKYEVTT